MRYFSLLLPCLLVPCFLISGCSSGAKRAVGIESSPPDEFAVIATPELVIPPNFDLRPPVAGTALPQTNTEALLFKKKTSSKGSLSRGESSLLGHIATPSNEGNIRTIIDAEYAHGAPDAAGPGEAEPGLFKRLLSVKKRQGHAPSVVDPVKEHQRIEANQKAGKPVTEGQTPVIKKSPTVLKEVLGQ
jgi:hypothetical protein